jgi:hypothetical protein
LPPPREACPAAGPARPLLDIADIFRAHGNAYRLHHVLTPEQAKAMRAIVMCRTAALGGHVDTCDTCGFERPAYNSCRNRHCPKCQGSAQAAWVEKHVARVLPTHYFHVVFTLPAELRPLVHRNRRLLFDLLFETASQTLLTLGEDRFEATLGLTAVLHTWTRDLSFHPHVHTIVTGGGLARDQESWVAADEEYLFPYLVLSRLFRGKFMAGLVQAYRGGELDLGGACESLAANDVFAAFKDRLYRKDWVVYQKPPFRSPEDVYRYLGRYTHRIAISNHRLESFDERGVCFRTKHSRKTTLSGEEFVRRFLLHVLPRRFVKIRHYGLMATRSKRSHERARRCLEATSTAASDSPSVEAVAPAEAASGIAGTTPPPAIDNLCPACLSGTLVSRPLPLSAGRPPPWSTRP